VLNDESAVSIHICFTFCKELDFLNSQEADGEANTSDALGM
jgi:hypothetical protein